MYKVPPAPFPPAGRPDPRPRRWLLYGGMLLVALVAAVIAPVVAPGLSLDPMPPCAQSGWVIARLAVAMPGGLLLYGLFALHADRRARAADPYACIPRQRVANVWIGLIVFALFAFGIRPYLQAYPSRLQPPACAKTDIVRPSLVP